MILGIAINPYAPNVSKSLIKKAHELSIQIRAIDLPSLHVVSDKQNNLSVHDKDGLVKIDALAPYLLFGFPTAVYILQILNQQAFLQNPVDNVLIADDKAATFIALQKENVPQVSTNICPPDFSIIVSQAKKINYPVVLKRTHGAQGTWVRRATDDNSLKNAFDELIIEGPGSLILQPQIVESKGKAIRVVITGSKIIAVTERTANGDEWRSNIAGGATQSPIDLTKEEQKMVLAAAKIIGLQHAGIDLLRTKNGPVILEVNSCPDYTSMIPYFKEDLTAAVLKASINQN